MRKKLIIVFVLGLLMMGIGSGIVFAEISSFHYGGEKNMDGEMTTVKLQQTVPEEAVYGLILERNDYYDEVSELFKMKDEFLKCVKNRVVYSYTYEDLGDITIKARPELASRITMR